MDIELLTIIGCILFGISGYCIGKLPEWKKEYKNIKKFNHLEE